jgi:RNA polymerase sigma-70 factor (ECF subfamily)
MARPTDGTPDGALSDEALVSATLGGDRNSYRALVERYQDRLLRVALDIVKNQQDAEDVVQESFVKAFLSLDKFKGQSSFFTWLFRITYNMALDLKRRSQRRGGEHFEYKEQLGVSTGMTSRDGQPDSAGTIASHSIEGPHEALVRKQTGSKLEQAFSQLSDEHRAVITLREVDGLDYEEIAQALGIPRGTVMSRLFYARKVLQRALQEIAPDGAPSEQERVNEQGVGVHQSSNRGEENADFSNNQRLKRSPG